MVGRRVKVSGIVGVEFLVEGDEGMEMRVTVFVEFPRNTNVKRVTANKFLSKEDNKVLGGTVTLGVGEENVFSLKAHFDSERGL